MHSLVEVDLCVRRVMHQRAKSRRSMVPAEGQVNERMSESDAHCNMYWQSLAAIGSGIMQVCSKPRLVLMQCQLWMDVINAFWSEGSKWWLDCLKSSQHKKWELWAKRIGCIISSWGLPNQLDHGHFHYLNSVEENREQRWATWTTASFVQVDLLVSCRKADVNQLQHVL